MKLRFLPLSITLALALPLLSSCNAFLSENPDSNLVDPATPTQVQKLLIGAYPTSSISYLSELSSDNILDDGVNNPNTSTFVEDAAYWKPIRNADDLYDAPYKIWKGCYYAVAMSNEVIQRVASLGLTDDVSMVSKGEALVARAWAHFQLANVFCLPYDPQTSSKDLGIPYVAERVVSLQPDYPRGTLAETYQHIASDLTAGIALLERYPSNYSEDLKKFHFGTTSAYAFAARFYLYYQNWAKAEEYATKVLGSNPALVLRDWSAFRAIPRTDQAYGLAYYDTKLPANLLSVSTYSTFHWQITNGTNYYNSRFTHAKELTQNETLSTQNIWGKDDAYLFAPFVYVEGNINKTVQPKFPTFPSSSYQTMDTPFTTDETLLVRAEARILQKKYDEGIADLNLWTSRYLNDGNDPSNPRKKTFTKDEIVTFYNKINYDSKTLPTLKKKLNPHFAITGVEEALLHHVLQCRRILTIHEGLRWQDVKRYGITVYRRINKNSNYIFAGQLESRDARQAIALPQQAVKGRIVQNPRK